MRQPIQLRPIWIMRSPKKHGPDDGVRINTDCETPQKGRASRYSSDRMQFGTPKEGLRQTMELRSICILICPKGAMPDDKAQILHLTIELTMRHPKGATPKGGLRQTIERRSTCILRCQKRAAPYNRAQIHMYSVLHQMKGA